MATGRESDKFMLRLPEGMRDEIKAAAEASGRSMNAEIVHALAKHLIFAPAAAQDLQRETDEMSDFTREVLKVVLERRVKIPRQFTELAKQATDEDE